MEGERREKGGREEGEEGGDGRREKMGGGRRWEEGGEVRHTRYKEGWCEWIEGWEGKGGRSNMKLLGRGYGHEMTKV